jgi:hypothetical protein
MIAVGISGCILGVVSLVVIVRVVSDVNSIAKSQAAKIHLPEVESAQVEEAKSWVILGMESMRSWAINATMAKASDWGFAQEDVNRVRSPLRCMCVCVCVG